MLFFVKLISYCLSRKLVEHFSFITFSNTEVKFTFCMSNGTLSCRRHPNLKWRPNNNWAWTWIASVKCCLIKKTAGCQKNTGKLSNVYNAIFGIILNASPSLILLLATGIRCEFPLNVRLVSVILNKIRSI